MAEEIIGWNFEQEAGCIQMTERRSKEGHMGDVQHKTTASMTNTEMVEILIWVLVDQYMHTARLTLVSLDPQP